MAVTAKLYGNALVSAFNKGIDWDSDTIKVSLHTSSYTPDQDAHATTSDLTNEVSNSGTGYTTGGNTLANCSTTYTGGTNTLKLDADDLTFSAVTLTARYAVIYDSTSSKLIGYIDFGADQSPSAANLVLTFNASGIITITVA